jgi:hypothetical protein
MMKMNIGVWIGIIGGAIGMAVGIASAITLSGSSGIYVTAIMLTVMAGMGLLFYKLLIGPMLNNSRLQKTGIAGKAKVLEVRDTGVTINRQPQVKLIVEVKDSLGQRYEATLRTLVSRINPYAFSAGMEIPVKIDPKNPKNIVIDYSGGTQTASGQSATTGGVNEAALKAELEAMQQENEAIRLSGKPARAIIKSYTWLGAYVNGDNPYIELLVEVLPDSAPSFSGTVKGVIAAASVNKYQPGCEIFVKYDFYDNSKVSIDHS